MENKPTCDANEAKELLEEFVKVAKENGVKRVDKKFLQRYLIGHQNKIPEALQAVKNFEDFVEKHRPTWLTLKKVQVEDYFEAQIVDVFHKDGLKDQKVCWIRVEKWNPKKITADEMLQISGLLCALVCEKYADIRCADFLLDLHNLSLKHVYAVTPQFAKNMVFFLAECLPMEVTNFYVVRQPRIFYVVFAIFKPFLNDRLRELIKICGNDFSMLFENIGGHILPADLGGTAEILKGTRWLNTLYNSDIQKELAISGYQFN